MKKLITAFTHIYREALRLADPVERRLIANLFEAAAKELRGTE